MTTATLAAADAWSSAPDYAASVSWLGQHDAAVVLKDGKKVLVAGGADAASAAVRQSAVYDLEQNTWAAPVLLGTARQLHALTLLPSGKVLITGGRGGPGAPALATAELYDPAQGIWTATKHPMAAGRWGHSAVLLSNGQVLVAGGSTTRPGGTVMAVPSAELFNPADETWTAAKDMTDARTGHTAVVLQAGKKVLVCGGSVPVGTGDDPALAFCELYDTDNKTWTPTGSLRHPRSAHTATALSDTTVLVTGGRAPGAPGDGSFDPFARATVEVYNLTPGSWQDTAPMPAGRALHRAVPLGSGKVLVVGGTDDVRNEAGYRSALEYSAGAWTTVPGLAEGRWGFAAAASGAKVIVAGGVARTGLAAAGQGTELTKTSERRGGGS
ncbi:Kelch repeat-containing protein [Actinomadura sp. HBU206391]|uniref:Kelch repeat-containing protein n=1 Tax=Actinomadura sp. HBU206391 TaxID=2731692 RepID=UPI00164F0B3B|nr:kelch repeat-containing protein [Actinomadura sp. HBU206391]MBC6458267.1 Kelch-like protein 17 [Actinomadura sp. HBU206391]